MGQDPGRQGFPRGDRGTVGPPGGSLQHVDLGITKPPGETAHGADAHGDTSRDRGDQANLVTKKASILLFLLNLGKHTHMTRGLGRVREHERKILRLNVQYRKKIMSLVNFGDIFSKTKTY